MTSLPPGLTCHACGHPMRLSRRTDAGYQHVGRCPRFCDIDGCDEPHHARGYCQHHDRLLRRHGHPLGRPAMETEDLAWMAETGETLDGAAKRLQRKPGSIERHLERIGRRDLYARLVTNGRPWQVAS